MKYRIYKIEIDYAYSTNYNYHLPPNLIINQIFREIFNSYIKFNLTFAAKYEGKHRGEIFSAAILFYRFLYARFFAVEDSQCSMAESFVADGSCARIYAEAK